MNIDMKLVGQEISRRRREKNLTQMQLGDRLNVSFQAVSKWERGESLPDVSLLPDLAAALEISIEELLTGGEKAVSFRGKARVEDMRDGLLALDEMGRKLGRDNLLYRAAIEGINEKLNTDIEQAFREERAFEAFLAEAVLDGIAKGKYVDLTDIERGFAVDHFRDIVLRYAKEHGLG